MIEPAVGNDAILHESIEKNVGLPLGLWEHLDFESADLIRGDQSNPSTSISGNPGMDPPTLGNFLFGKKTKYSLTTRRLARHLAVLFGSPDTTDLDSLPGPWLLKYRPDPSKDPRGMSLHLHEGGSYSASMTTGRRIEDVTIASDGNKRCDVAIGYTSPGRSGGDTISGFAIGKSGNANLIGAPLLKVGTRGRRPYDADFTAGKSVYLKVVSGDANSVVVKAKVDMASPGDGSSFPGGAYGSTTTTFYPVNDDLAHDGWSTVKDSTSGLAIGLFDENNEPFQVTLGAVLPTVAANEEIEIPVKLGKVVETAAAALWAASSPGIVSDANTGTEGSIAAGADTTGSVAGALTGKSLYIRFAAFGATVKAKIDNSSPGDGSAFPAGGYGATTFAPTYTVGVHDPVIDSTSGLQIGTLAIFMAAAAPGGALDGDEIEFPLSQLPEVSDVELQISAYHKVILLDGTAFDFDKGTLKIARPYKETPGLSSRRPNVDRSGKLGVTLTLDRRMFNRYFRQRGETLAQFQVLVVYKIESVVPGTTRFRQVVVWLPTCIVAATKATVAGFDVLTEGVTIEAIQPPTNPTPPTGDFGSFDADKRWPVQVNVITEKDPAHLNP